jgi:hypothetical protein
MAHVTWFQVESSAALYHLRNFSESFWENQWAKSSIHTFSRLSLFFPGAFPGFTKAMVANYGMSDKIGLLNFGQNDASSQFYKPYSSLVKSSWGWSRCTLWYPLVNVYIANWKDPPAFNG